MLWLALSELMIQAHRFAGGAVKNTLPAWRQPSRRSPLAQIRAFPCTMSWPISKLGWTVASESSNC
jgi:hypothetical protein